MTSATIGQARTAKGRGGEGYGMVVFASALLGMIGFFNLLDGIAAIANSSFYIANARYVVGDLRAWGWVALILGVLDIVLGVGFLQVKPWAWTLGIVLEIVSIVLAVINIVTTQSIFNNIISIAIAGYILYYLNTPTVKQAFGRAA